MPPKRMKSNVNEDVLRKLKRQIKREQAAERRDTIRVDPELDEAIEAYVAEINKNDPSAKLDRGKLWRTAAREYLGLSPKANAGVEYIPIAELEMQPA